MKALIAILSTAPEGENSGEDLRSCRASLQALGIDHHVAKADAMPTDSYVNTHDFIVFPSVPNNLRIYYLFMAPGNKTGTTVYFFSKL